MSVPASAARSIEPASMPLQLPLKVQIDGRDAILVSPAAFDAAFGHKSRPAASPGLAARLQLSADEIIFRDREVARFLIEGAERNTTAFLHKICRMRFGAARTPSRTNLYMILEDVCLIRSTDTALAELGL